MSVVVISVETVKEMLDALKDAGIGEVRLAGSEEAIQMVRETPVDAVVLVLGIRRKES